MKSKGIIRIIITFTFLIIFFSGGILPKQDTARAANVNYATQDGVYSLPVSLWHATKDQESLGNKSLYQTGKLVVIEGKAKLYIKFTGMEFSGMSGYLLQLDLIEDIKFNEFNYPEKYSLIPAEVISTYSVLDAFNGKESTDVNAAGKRYPKVVALTVDPGTEYLWAHVYVPVMGSLGFGDQICRVKISFDKAEEMTSEAAALWEEYEIDEEETEEGSGEKAPVTGKIETDKSETSKSETGKSDTDTKGQSGAASQNTTDQNITVKAASGDTKELQAVYNKAKKLLQKDDEYTKASLNKLEAAMEIAVKALNTASAQTVLDAQTKVLNAAIAELVKKEVLVLKKENLLDGKYSVYVDLWNASADKASMGNPAFNHEALLTVKKGVYTLEISTRPMTVAGITACLQTLQVKQPDGSYQYAEITARNNEENQPSIFRFILPTKEEYTDVYIDPKVEIVTKDVLPARLKISWDTLKQLEENATITENTQSITKDETASAADLTDEATGVRIFAKANIIAQGTGLRVSKVTSGEEYNEAVNLLATEAAKLHIYQINLISEEGEEVQPSGMVKVYLPLNGDIKAENAVVYRIENGGKVLMSGKSEGDYYVFETNHFSLYTLAEKNSDKAAEVAAAVSNPLSETSENQSSTQEALDNVTETAREDAGAGYREPFSDKEAWAMTRMLLGISLVFSFVITIIVVITISRTAEGKRRSHEI
jgi:hypothetical protein